MADGKRSSRSVCSGDGRTARMRLPPLALVIASVAGCGASSSKRRAAASPALRTSAACTVLSGSTAYPSSRRRCAVDAAPAALSSDAVASKSSLRGVGGSARRVVFVVAAVPGGLVRIPTGVRFSSLILTAFVRCGN